MNGWRLDKSHDAICKSRAYALFTFTRKMARTVASAHLHTTHDTVKMQQRCLALLIVCVWLTWVVHNTKILRFSLHWQRTDSEYTSGESKLDTIQY